MVSGTSAWLLENLLKLERGDQSREVWPGKNIGEELGETAIIKLVFYTESVQLTETCRKRDSFLFITARTIVAV